MGKQKGLRFLAGRGGLCGRGDVGERFVLLGVVVNELGFEVEVVLSDLGFIFLHHGRGGGEVLNGEANFCVGSAEKLPKRKLSRKAPSQGYNVKVL